MPYLVESLVNEHIDLSIEEVHSLFADLSLSGKLFGESPERITSTSIEYWIALDMFNHIVGDWTHGEGLHQMP